MIIKRIFTTITAAAVALAALAGAEATFKEKHHNFGNIHEERQFVTHIFEVENTGDKPLLIIEAVASCGCTKPEFDTKPIKPGKKGKVKVTYSTVGRPGAFSKTVRVKTNAEGKTKVTTLLIEGTVIPKSKK